jgi:hypothetical protein
VLPIVYAFVRVLLVSAVGVIPGQTWASFGTMLLVLALLDLGRMPWTLRGMLDTHRHRERLSLADWGWYVVYPTVASLSLAVTGLSLAMGWPLPVQLLAAGMLAHLVIGVHNAWELADWLATRQ